jgi:hypothetical protein
MVWAYCGWGGDGGLTLGPCTGREVDGSGGLMLGDTSRCSMVMGCTPFFSLLAERWFTQTVVLARMRNYLLT